MSCGQFMSLIWIIWNVQAAYSSIQDFRIECLHLLRPNSIDVASFLTDTTNFTIRNAFAVSVFVTSPCCDDITIISENERCSKCSKNGMKICQLSVETVQMGHIQNRTCREQSHIKMSCESQVCTLRTGEKHPPLYKPGDKTECIDGNNSVCLKNGTWSESHDCNQTETSVLPGLIVTPDSENLAAYSTQTTTTTNYVTMVTSDLNNSSSIDGVSTYMNRSSVFNETVEGIDSDKAAMKDLYTFLSVFGVILVLVFMLVCGFFIRKQRDKVTITDLDNPLEYWQEVDYIDNVVQRSYTKSTTFTVNPVYNNDDPIYSKPRYKKKGDTEKERRSNATDDACGSTGVNYNAFKSNQGNAVNARESSQTYGDKYIATASGSHFYNYSPTQSEDVLKRTTDFDGSSEEDTQRSMTSGLTMETFTGRPSMAERRHKRGFRNTDHSGDQWDEDNARIDRETERYTMDYGRRLKNTLDDWSAEESDV